jgi:AcrR family transcriptional regulator
MSPAGSDAIPRLPAGPHGIPPELVARNQRERLISAMAEACADKGYAEIAVADVVRRAGVSTATFYKRFDGKRDCMLAAHEELSGRLLEEVDRACATASDWEPGVRAAIGTVLELFAADAATARLLTVEILALGTEGAARHAATIETFASRLRAGRDPRRDPESPHSDWATVAAIAALIGKVVMDGEGTSLLAFEDELAALAFASGQ